MAVKPVVNVPKVKNPYGSLGPSPGTVKKITSTGLQTNAGWGAATQANNLNNVPGNTLTYDVPSAPAVTAPAGGGAASTPGYWNVPNYKDLLAGTGSLSRLRSRGSRQQRTPSRRSSLRSVAPLSTTAAQTA